MNYAVKNIYGKIKNKRAEVTVGGSKSISARALLIAAVSHGESTLRGVPFSDDFSSFTACLKGLGITVEAEGDTVRINGCGGKLKQETAGINVGSAGTAARFLPAFLAFQPGRFTLDCSAQMKKRPIEPLLRALRGLGAEFTFLDKEYSYPFVIEGTSAPRGRIEVDITESSQYLSALLIAASCSDYPIYISAKGAHSLGYVNITVDMMRSFGIEVTEDEGEYVVNGTGVAREYYVEPDISSACYFYAMNRILGTEISVKGVMTDSKQGDIKFIELLKNFGGGKVDMREFSDQALTLAAIAPYFSEPTEICGVGHIRRQECDRIAAIVKNLASLGVKCEERSDGVKIFPSAPRPARIDACGDHRVAMSFALTGLRSDGVVIENAEVCSKTFKEFFNVLDGLCGELTR